MQVRVAQQQQQHFDLHHGSQQVRAAQVKVFHTIPSKPIRAPFPPGDFSYFSLQDIYADHPLPILQTLELMYIYRKYSALHVSCCIIV
jgi:hypothetical protein